MVRDYAGDMAHLFHIRPWEWDLLTYGQTRGLCTAIDKYRAEMAKGAK